jgi:hypothetical protein
MVNICTFFVYMGLKLIICLFDNRVNQISSSPVEPIFVCAGSSNKQDNGATLVAWSMKTMSACVSLFHYCLFIYLFIYLHSK